MDIDEELSDTLIDALQDDLECNVASTEPVEAEDSSIFRHDTQIDATVDEQSWSVESRAVSVCRARAGAVHQGRIAGFAHRGVKRLRVVPRVSQASTVPAVEEGSRAESHIHRRDEAVPSPLLAQDASFGERSDLGMEPVAEVQILETVNDERDSHSSVGELDQVSDVADEDDRLSEEGGPDPVESEGEEQPIFRLPGVASLRTGFTFLESVDLVEVFQERACVMKSVPRFLRGPYRIAMRVALEEIVAGYRSHNKDDTSGAWVEVVSAPSTDVVAPWAPRWRNPQTKVVGKVRDVREGSVGQSSGSEPSLWRQSSSCQTSTYTQR